MSEDKQQKGHDINKAKDIIETLRKFPEGIWLRKLSRETSMPVSTVHYYIDNVLDSFVESRGAKDEEGNFFGIRLIKLRDGVNKQLDSGKSVEYILKTENILTGNED